MMPAATPPQPGSSSDKLTSSFSLRWLLLAISLICIWGALAGYAFGGSTPVDETGLLGLFVVISGLVIFVVYLQIVLYLLLGSWLRNRKVKQ